MSRPTLTASGDALTARLKPLLAGDGEANGWMGTLLLGGIGAILDAGASLRLVTEDTPDRDGWTIIADPDLAPLEWLPWQSDATGVTLTVGASEDVHREELRDLPPQERGTTDAIVTSTMRTLTDTRLVRTIERPSGNAYEITIVVRTAETPDPAAAEKAARSQKPGGLKLNFVVSDAPILDEGTDTIDSVTTATIDDATLADVT